jgi:hypothetical protein
LSAFVERVYALPQLKQHLATRKFTDFWREFQEINKFRLRYFSATRIRKLILNRIYDF